jgi:hypothetical protein
MWYGSHPLCCAIGDIPHAPDVHGRFLGSTKTRRRQASSTITTNSLDRYSLYITISKAENTQHEHTYYILNIVLNTRANSAKISHEQPLTVTMRVPFWNGEPKNTHQNFASALLILVEF